MQRLTTILNHINPSDQSPILQNQLASAETQVGTKQYDNGCFEITLKRPKALNSLTLDMIQDIYQNLKNYKHDDKVKAIIMRAETKGFCAGGDLKEFISPNGRWRFAYKEEIYRYPKPYITLIDGNAMGGGVGISVHGKYRVVTEKLLWAMPEAIVGFFTDVGSTHFLARCRGHVGLYLALTGAKIRVADAMYCGIGTHFVPSAEIENLRNSLSSENIDSQDKVEAILQRYSKPVEGKSNLQELQEKIDYCFGAETVEGIVERLQKDDTKWAQETLSALLHNCPTSLKVIHEALKRSKNLTTSKSSESSKPTETDFEESISIELRLADRMVNRRDIAEGVRAKLVDRDDSPKWEPARLQDVSRELVDSMFVPFEDPSKELRFE